MFVLLPALCSRKTDNSQPAFLQRLRGQLTSGDSARHEQPVARNKRVKDDDQDDAPTYVMEDTNQSLTKEEYDALVSGKDSKEDEKSTLEEARDGQAAKHGTKLKDKIAEVGGNAKKRKAAKVISDEQGDSHGPADGTKKTDAKVIKKSKKKSKAIKLAFGDDEEG